MSDAGSGVGPGALRAAGAPTPRGRGQPDREEPGSSAADLVAIAEQWTAADDAGDFSRHQEWMHPDTEIHLVSRGRVLRGPQEWVEFMRAYRAGVADLRTTIHDRFATEDRLAHRWTLTGTHSGDLFGMPPTGQPIRVEGASVWECREGRPERVFVYSSVVTAESAGGGSAT